MVSRTDISRRGFLAGATTMVGLVLAGCATTTSSSAGKGVAATQASTINLYGNSLGENGQKEAWQAVVSAFEKKQGITIKPVVYPYDQAATQLALVGRSGDLHGVGQAGPWQVLYPMGLLADLTEAATGLGIPQGVLDAYTVDGKLVVLPIVAAGIGMIVNGEIATAAGLRSGLSTTEFATALEKIKTQDPKLIPYAAVTKNPDLKDGVHWMWGFGSEVVTKDLKSTIGDRESVEAITWYKSLLDQGLIKANVARGDARILFASGRTALYDDAPLASTFVKTNGAAPNVIANISAIARPQQDGKPSFNRTWGGGLFVAAGAGELTAREFARFVASDVPAATVLYQQSAVAPASPSVAAQIPALSSDKFQTAFRTEVAEHARGAAWDRVAVAAQIDTTIGAGVATILAGQVDVQQGLNQLGKNVQDLLDANK